MDMDMNIQKKQKKEKGSITHINYNAVATEFSKYYYTCLDTKNMEILNLFKSKSMMNFYKEEYKGEYIISKYKQIFENNIKHNIEQIIAIPDGSRRINVMITGTICIGDEAGPKQFTQYFHLCWLGDGQYWIKDTIFTFI